MSVSREPLHDIAHLGAVELLTPAPQRSLWFFREVLGMELVHTTSASAWLRGYGDYAAATLKLTASKAAGVGTIGLVDFDIVEITNLQRQLLHGTSDVGRAKLDSAQGKVEELARRVEQARPEPQT